MTGYARRGLASRLLDAALLAALTPACGDVLGIGDPVAGVDCFVDADCPTSQMCRSQQCVAAVDACQEACALGHCLQSQCVSGEPAWGLTSGSDTFTVESQYLTAFPAQIAQCAYLVGLGLSEPLQNLLPTHVRLGIYNDDGGPTSLLAQTDEQVVTQDMNPWPIVGTQPSVACDGHHTYWLAIESDLDLTVQTLTTSVPFDNALQSGAVDQLYLSRGLPTPWPGEGQGGGAADKQPMIYPLIVEENTP